MSGIEKRIDVFLDDYKKTEKARYSKFAKLVLEKIRNALNARQIAIAYSSCREKDIVSLEKKCHKKVENEKGELVNKYADVKNEIMDLAGVRIVTYLLDDVYEIRKIVEELFDIIYEHSGDKLDLLGADKIGYLSVHYIVNLKESLLGAGEEDYSGLKCEIQIRTVLEDAWAQIFHDRQYKNSIEEHVFSDNLKRKTNLLSGNLELLDYQINDIVKEYDRINRMEESRKLRILLEQPISRENIIAYIYLKFGKNVVFFDYEKMKTILNEYGVKNIRKLDSCCNSTNFCNKISNFSSYITADKIISYILMIKDSNKFFKKIGTEVVLSKESSDFLGEFIDIDAACEKFNIKIKERDNGGGK